MAKTIDYILDGIPHDCFTDIELMNILSGGQNRRYGLIKRAIANKEVIHLRRGLYYLSERYRRHPLNLFNVAQRIYGPSYISLESALSYHGWIPESVPTTTSASYKRSREFATPLGTFAYLRVTSSPFFASVGKILTAPGEVHFIASPWKAIADYIYVNKKDWNGIHPLVHSLRIDEDSLGEVEPGELEEIEESFKSRRIGRFLTGVRKELKL